MKRFSYILLVCLVVSVSCHAPGKVTHDGVYLVVLGTVQDAGSPQLACRKTCCRNLSKEQKNSRMVSCLAVLDGYNNKAYLLDATPDLPRQWALLEEMSPGLGDAPAGVLLSHAHIGHYTGLMYFGKESTGSEEVPCYAMPRMREFIRHNGPWSQLVSEKNIRLENLAADSTIVFENFSVTAFLVPHRDEFSETVGFKLEGPGKTAVFIPDIDKWTRWDRDISELVKSSDYAFLDATFYDQQEMPNRDISDIPHPFVIESFKKFESLDSREKDRIHFLHLNHTNPLLNPESWQSKDLKQRGYHVAYVGQTLPL